MYASSSETVERGRERKKEKEKEDRKKRREQKGWEDRAPSRVILAFNKLLVASPLVALSLEGNDLFRYYYMHKIYVL